MKKIKLVILLIFLLFNQSLKAQYFIDNQLYQLYELILGTNSTVDGAYFDFVEINNSRLSFVHSLSYSQSSIFYRNGFWQSNNGGSFGSPTSYYSLTTGTNSNIMKGIVTVDLSLDGKKDPVIVKNNELQVHHNNGSISGIIQTISSGAGDYIDKGRFNYQDEYEDIVVKSGSNVRIYENLQNGYLNPASYGPFNIGNGKFRFAQMTDKDEPFTQSNSSDREDFITINGNNIKVYKNNNNNTINTTPYADINVGHGIQDLDIGDITGDGINDIIITSTFPTNKVSLYNNVQGVLINPNPIWSYTRTSVGYVSPLVKIADINRDGLNDVVVVANGILIDVFINSVTGLASTPTQTLQLQLLNSSISDIDINDIYNQGGQALTLAVTHGFSELTHRVLTVLATNPNPSPVPPIVIKDTYLQGSVVRPRLILRNRGERDQTQYQIWKRKDGPNFSHIATVSSSGNSEFIDYSEYLIIDDGLPGEDNCWYKVKAIDAISQTSDFSNQVGYTVGQAACIGCSEDNPESITINQIPTEYSTTNFPNPFNPSTKIAYALPIDGIVKISVYNSLGQEVKTLINEFKNQGTHLVEFNGSDLSSGIYYYKIEVNDFVKINKMVLIK